MNRTGFLGDLISWEDGVYGTSKSVFPGGARACRPDGRGAPGEAHASEWAVRQSVAPKIGKSTLLGQAVGAAVTGRGFLGESAACGQIAIVTEEPIRLAAAAIRTAREKDRNG